MIVFNTDNHNPPLHNSGIWWRFAPLASNAKMPQVLLLMSNEDQWLNNEETNKKNHRKRMSTVLQGVLDELFTSSCLGSTFCINLFSFYSLMFCLQRQIRGQNENLPSVHPLTHVSSLLPPCTYCRVPSFIMFLP